MNANDMQAIDALDLEPIKVKLMHKESGEGWPLAQANAVEAEYRRFLYLMKTFPHEQAAPRVDVDIFWHYHILDTMKYALDCEAVFGHFLHHFPYIGLRGEDDEAAHQRIGARMRQLYEATFGDDYARGMDAGAHDAAAAYSARAAIGTAYSARAVASAYSAAPGVTAITAYSAAPGAVGSAEAEAAIDKARLSSFFSERPRLNPTL